ncbi:hypothetical protein VCHA34P129_40206 [Vibrio chagasii]|nr:hypothetical protein VCHA34P129_40206 [Vibrio chagasii]CAH7305855.1 hypothetical protein VCHA52P455_40206 [Vibrio chagasii]
MEFKNRLKETLAAKKLTQHEGGLTVGCGQSLIQAYVSGARRPVSPEGALRLIKLAELMDITIDEFIRELTTEEGEL